MRVERLRNVTKCFVIDAVRTGDFDERVANATHVAPILHTRLFIEIVYAEDDRICEEDAVALNQRLVRGDNPPSFKFSDEIRIFICA